MMLAGGGGGEWFIILFLEIQTNITENIQNTSKTFKITACGFKSLKHKKLYLE